jgi:hypothetical protein
VPVLIADGRPIRESTLINEYLEDAYPETPLRPDDPYEGAAMRLWCKVPDDGLHFACAARRDGAPDTARKEHRRNAAGRRARRDAVVPAEPQPDRPLVGRSGEPPNFAPLFRDRAAEGLRYYRKTGIYPINHGMVIKREVAEKHPWAVLNILKAFVAANEMADRRRLEHVEYYRASGLLTPEAYEALKEPLVRHGIAANRATLETAAQYSLEQGLTPRLVALDEVFARSTLDQ